MLYTCSEDETSVKNKGVKKMKAIKNWFLEKSGLGIMSIKNLQQVGFETVRETEKAVLVKYINTIGKHEELWVPKSCMADEWEHTFSPKLLGGAYHSYLVDVYTREYRSGNMGEQITFKSGRNVYDGASFKHQWKTNDLMEALDKYGIKYMTKKEYAETL